MNTRNIFITENDKIKLKKLLDNTKIISAGDLKTVTDLLDEIDRAQEIRDENLDESVVTMNSRVAILDLGNGQEYIYTIVYPEHANSSENKISILAPIGTALLGYKVGDIVEWEVPAGKRRFLIKAILFQPEAANKRALANRVVK